MKRQKCKKNMAGKGGGLLEGGLMFLLRVGNVSNQRGDLTRGGEKISDKELGPSKKLWI